MALIEGYSSDDEDEQTLDNGVASPAVKKSQFENEAAPFPTKRKPSASELFANLPTPKNRKGPRIIVLEREVIEESEDSNVKRNEPILTQRPPRESQSVSSFLPAPRRTADSSIKEIVQSSNKSDSLGITAQSISISTSRKTKPLGGGIKNTFDGEIRMPSTLNLETTPSTSNDDTRPLKKIKLIPAAVAARIAKYGSSRKEQSKPGNDKKTDTISKLDGQNTIHEIAAITKSHSKEPSPEPELSLFSYYSAANAQKPGSSLPASDYVPIMLKQEQQSEPIEWIEGPTSTPHDTSQNSQSPPKPDLKQMAQSMGISSHEIDRMHARGNTGAVKVVDFSIDNFYEENEALKKQGRLDGNKPVVHAIGGGRHHLSTLLRSAQQNKEGLEEVFVREKKNKWEAASKYGF